jgi:hypothetical protein
MTDKESISVCGLDRDDCDINKMITDSEADERTIVWFRSRGWLKENEGMDEVSEKRMYCTGCLGIGKHVGRLAAKHSSAATTGRDLSTAPSARISPATRSQIGRGKVNAIEPP